jgi:two-component system response regulator YesN
MYNLLIVDDEMFAVKGISKGIDWSELGIGRIYEAYDYESACDIMSSTPIHIVLADIEMPGKSGLELLQWMNENHFAPVTIFLTGHADFQYAQKALDLGSFKYMLKPVDHEELKRIARNAISKYSADRDSQNFNERYQTYVELWEKQLPILRERLWQDVLSSKLLASSGQVKHMLQQYRLPLTADSLVVPILISVEEWYKELSVRDEEIMQFALRSAASDVFFQSYKGDVIQDHHESVVVLLYMEEDQSVSFDDFQMCCQQYIEACNQYFYCCVSCYIGDPTPVHSVVRTYSILVEMERNKTKNQNNVFLQSQSVFGSEASLPIPWLPDWLHLIEMGKKDELLLQLDQLCAALDQDPRTTIETLESIYHGLVYMLRFVIQKKYLKIDHVFDQNSGFYSRHAVKSVPYFHSWAKKMIVIAIEAINACGKSTSSIIEKVQHYITNHMMYDITRDEIASSVYLNPAYLSRLYKQETGHTLTDYIIHVRVEKAKSLLAESNIKISEVSLSVGYSHFSHFSKIFKKMVGVTPQEFRKQYHTSSYALPEEGS